MSIILKRNEQYVDLAAGTTRYAGVGAKATLDDPFEIGSSTESFTAVAIPASGGGRPGS